MVRPYERSAEFEGEFNVLITLMADMIKLTHKRNMAKSMLRRGQCTCIIFRLRNCMGSTIHFPCH
jgi:hypothetical protein